MESKSKLGAFIACSVVGLSGCQNPMIDEAFGGHPNTAPARTVLATQPEASQKIKTQISPPGDKQTATAIKEAMNNIGMVLAIHACIKDEASLRLMNAYAVPGVNMVNIPMYYPFPDSAQWLPYHDRSKCVSLRTLDQWEMPALNALTFRVVYYADDSGETVNFAYLFKKVDDGTWKVEKFNRSN